MHAFGQLPQAGIFLVVLMNPALNGLHLIVLMIGMCRQPGVNALQVVTHIDDKCPGQFPVRLPQISILLYFPGTDSIDGWHLASDRDGGFNTGPGATLHADWWGGWNDEAMDLWTSGCMQAARNCSYGQTGTSIQLASLNPLQRYEGPNLLALPDGSYPRP